jgi:hypothetical protein
VFGTHITNRKQGGALKARSQNKLTQRLMSGRCVVGLDGIVIGKTVATTVFRR